MAVYSPLKNHELRDKEEFYHKLDSVVGRCPAGDVLVVLGDFNAETGSDMAGYELCLGPHGFRARNGNTQFLLEFAKSRGLWIGGFLVPEINLTQAELVFHHKPGEKGD